MELENIYFRINKDTERLSTEYYNDDELERYYRTISLDIYGRMKIDEENEFISYENLEEIPLGFVEGVFINMSLISKEIGEQDVWAIFDNIDDQTSNLGNLIFENDQIYSEVVGAKGNLFWIKNLFIYEKYRGEGVGTRVLTELESAVSWIFDYDIGSFIVNPTLCDTNSYRDNTTGEINNIFSISYKQVTRFFKELGFRKVRSGSHFMYFNTDYEMYNEIEL